MILDLHTHHLPEQPGTAIVNATPENFCPQPGDCYSVGIHPWQVETAGESLWSALENMVYHPQVLAVGEAGIDRHAAAPPLLQQEAFRRQAILAETVGKPLIIHAVKAMDELLRLKKELSPSVAWIIHGFRGKPQQAVQWLRHGFCLSYGVLYQPESLCLTPLENLFIETDESCLPVRQCYERAALLRRIPVELLLEAVQQNFHRLGMYHLYNKEGQA